jgi:holo-[acyl-carrier protein] synthase
MIYGIGTDIVDIRRIKKAHLKHGERFESRILTEKERIKLYEHQENEERFYGFIANRFAAKEAISKAMGTGIGRGLSFLDIEISNDILGKPIAAIKKLPKSYHIHVSISGEKKTFCIASAVIEKK